MNKILPFLNQLLASSSTTNLVYQRNVVKQYLQILVLNHIYAHPEYSQLIFYGGSCLAQCYDMPRLSEDLDFVDLKNEISIEQLAQDLKKSLIKETGLHITTSVRKFQINLKFPLLHELSLSKAEETDLLFLKVEVFNQFNFCEQYSIETVPLFKYNQSLLVKTFDLSTLMSTKIRAVLNRKWVKKDKSGKILVAVKGRDFFDLMWYLNKGVKPNLKCIEMAADKQELAQKLLAVVNNLDQRSIRLDLENFIEDKTYLENLSKNLKQILIRELESW
jgi:predicted nucleotidyltransferase component of viral defense system